MRTAHSRSRVHHRILAFRTGAVLLWAAPTLAAANEVYRLELSADSGAEPCLVERPFADEVEQHLGRNPFDDAAGSTIRVHLERSTEGYRASVAIDETDRPPARTTFEGTTCGDVLRAAAVTLGLALGKEAPTADEHPAEPRVLPVVLEDTTPADPEMNGGSAAPRAANLEADRPSRSDRATHWESLPRNWLALELAQDFAGLESMDGACSPEGRSIGRVSCFEGEVPYGGAPHPERAGDVRGGVTAATTRLLASYERSLSRRIGVAFRGGFAFGDSLPKAHGSQFQPIHAELDARYYVAGKDGSPIDAFLFAGTGIAQVTTSVAVDVMDCPDVACVEAAEPDGSPRSLRLYVHRGLAFATAGFGATWMAGDRFGLFGRLGAMAMFPSTGFVIQPSVGMTTGF
jgi:hypothetical protein